VEKETKLKSTRPRNAHKDPSQQTIVRTASLCYQTTTTTTIMKSALKTLIAPSLLSCDLARIAEDANNMLELGADWLVRASYLRCVASY